jgi:ABC-type amino acid transport substrate-binding protein
VQSSAILAYPTRRSASASSHRRIDAVVHDAPVLIWFASRDEANVAPILKLLGDEPLAWAMRRGDDDAPAAGERGARALAVRRHARRILARWLPYWQRLESAERSR